MKTLILCTFLLQNLIFSINPSVEVPTTGDPFVHSVYFWLKDGLSENDHVQFEEVLKDLKKVKSVKKLYVLTPAGTPRDVVDNSYDFALIIHFKDREAQDAYQVDPLHMKAVEQMRPMIDRFIVYDAL